MEPKRKGAGVGRRHGEPNLVRNFAGIVVACLSIPFAPWAVAAPPSADTPFRSTLPSGVHLIVQEMPNATTVAIDLRVRAGSALDLPDHSGAAHFLEHLVFKGTDTRAPGNIDTTLENLGGELDARTSRDGTQFAVTLPAGEKPWHDALTVLADMVLHPALRPTDIDAERSVIQAEMRCAEAEPLRLGYSLLYDAAFPPDNANHLPLMGTEESIAHLSADDLRTAWTAHYKPSNLTLVIAGNVHAAEVARFAATLFPASADSLPRFPPLKTAEITVTQPIEGIVRAPLSPRQNERELATVLIGLRAPGANTPDEIPALDVLMLLLADGGDGPNGHGRLHTALVETQKIALSVSAEYLPGRTEGLIVLTATSARADAARLEAALLAELARLPEDAPDEAETESARQKAVGTVRYEAQTPTGTARHWALLDTLGIPPAAADATSEHIAAVKAADLQRAAARYLTWGRCAVAVVGTKAGTGQ